MTDKEKKSKIADILMDFQEEYSNEVINRPMLASIYAENILSFIDSLQEEPSSKDKFTFTSLPRLLDMKKPTDRAKWYSSRLADALEKEGYITDAKIVRESIKIMNGEKVPMATMDEEPVSEDLPHIRHRDTLDEFAYQCAYDLSNDWAKETPEWNDVKTACKLGAQWQKQQMMKDSVEGIVYAKRTNGEIMVRSHYFQSDKLDYNDKVKLIIIKQD